MDNPTQFAPPEGSVAPKFSKRIKDGELPPYITSYGVRFPTDMPPMLPRIRNALAEDRYEAKESEAALKVLNAGDRVVELGAGLGYMSSVISKNCAPESVHAFEANPALIPCIKRVQQENDITNVTVHNAVLGAEKGQTLFYVRSNFVASSLMADPVETVVQKVTVPVLPARDTVAEINPNVLICDIEGAEVDIIPLLDLTNLRAAIVELHPQYIGLRGVEKVFAAMTAAGLIYNPRRSMAKVVTFSRPE